MSDTLERFIPRKDAPRGWRWHWVRESTMFSFADWPIWNFPLESTLDNSGDRWYLVLVRSKH